jgi:hypothetical protein
MLYDPNIAFEIGLKPSIVLSALSFFNDLALLTEQENYMGYFPINLEAIHESTGVPVEEIEEIISSLEARQWIETELTEDSQGNLSLFGFIVGDNISYQNGRRDISNEILEKIADSAEESKTASEDPILSRAGAYSGSCFLFNFYREKELKAKENKKTFSLAFNSFSRLGHRPPDDVHTTPEPSKEPKLPEKPYPWEPTANTFPVHTEPVPNPFRSILSQIGRAEPCLRDQPTLKGDSKHELNNRAKQSQSQEKIIATSSEVKAIVDIWNSLGLRKVIPASTKSYRDNVSKVEKFLNGSLYVGISGLQEYAQFYSISDFETTSEKFFLAATDPNYQPLEKKWLKTASLGSFLYNERGITDRSRSYFLWYLVHDPELETQTKNIDPLLCQAIRKGYAELVLKDPLYKPDLADQTYFVVGSNKLTAFVKGTQFEFWSIDQKVELIFQALTLQWGIPRIRPFSFAVDSTFKHTIPAYLAHKGVKPTQTISMPKSKINWNKPL